MVATDLVDGGDVEPGTIFAGFVISTIGFSFFFYGKKQARLPQLIAGMVLMACPIFVRDPLWMTAVAAAALAGMRGMIACET